MKPVLMSIQAEYVQAPDSGDDTPGLPEQVLRLAMTHCGGGPYLVIQTERWSMDKAQELHSLMRKFVAQVETLFDRGLDA